MRFVLFAAVTLVTTQAAMVPAFAAEAPISITFIADSQQRDLFGGSTGFSGRFAQDSSQVAVRSSEQELFAKYVMRAVIEREREADLVVHLGDFLDYSCESEWVDASSALTAEQWARTALVAGNHDGLFQGNDTYGGFVKGVLQLRKLFNNRYDPTLEGHFNAVCAHEALNAKKRRSFNFRKRDVFCSRVALMTAPRFAVPVEVNRACGYVEFARSNRVDGRPDARVDLPLQHVGNWRSGSTDVAYKLEAWFPEASVATWGRGYFLQVFELSPANRIGDGPAIVAVLLDTSDWQSRPGFKGQGECDKPGNTDCGSVSKKQRDAVAAFLATVPAGTTVLLGGHYPLKAMEGATAEWLRRIVSGRAPHAAYFSAHTHFGDVYPIQAVAQGKAAWEFNVDSLIDWPITYWNLMKPAEGGAACLSVHHPWKELGCDAALEDARYLVERAAKLYSAGIREGFDQGEAQWRWRARDADRAMLAFAQVNGISVKCVKPNFDKDGLVAISRALRSCMKQVDDAVVADPKLVRLAACTSLAGAAAFRGRHPEELPSRRAFGTRCLN